MTTNKVEFFIVAHNIRSLFNIGTIFRTADALGVDRIYLTGYSGHPPASQIAKVALGSENSVPWEYQQNISSVFKKFKKQGVKIVALELGAGSVVYNKFKPQFPLALLLGNEVRGVSKALLRKVDSTIYLPMYGQKESLNVGVAMGVAGYYIKQYINYIK